MKDSTRVHNALNEEDIIADIVFLIQNAKLLKLRASRSDIHVRFWPLKAVAIHCWFKGLNDVLLMVLICSR